jgi:hypothetical protein
MNSTIRRLAKWLDQIPKGHGVINCPFDDDSVVLAWFEYPAGPSNPVKIGISGCGGASNGHVGRLLIGSEPGARAWSQIKRLTRSPS